MSEREDIFYSNQVTVAVSPWDITLLFQIVTAQRTEGKRESSIDAEVVPLGVPISERTVVMSPQHAKSLVALLSNSLAAYEERVGKIPLDKEWQDRYDQMMKINKSAR